MASMSSHSDSEVSSTSKLINTIRFKAKERVANKKNGHILEYVRMKRPSVYASKLLTAVSVNNIEMAKRLLSKGVSPDSQDEADRSGLHIAVSRGYTDMLKLLLDYGADPNCRDILLNTPLHLAACNSNLKIITLLIDAGAELRYVDLNGNTPLCLAESKLSMLLMSRKGKGPMDGYSSQVREVKVLEY